MVVAHCGGAWEVARVSHYAAKCGSNLWCTSTLGRWPFFHSTYRTCSIIRVSCHNVTATFEVMLLQDAKSIRQDQEQSYLWCSLVLFWWVLFGCEKHCRWIAAYEIRCHLLYRFIFAANVLLQVDILPYLSRNTWSLVQGLCRAENIWFGDLWQICCPIS